MNIIMIIGMIFFSGERAIAWQAAMLCSICATIWGLRRLLSGAWMNMGKRWSMPTAGFM